MSAKRTGLRRLLGVVLTLAFVALLVGGCKPPAVTFPADPVVHSEQLAGYDTNGDKRPDFFLLSDSAGRVDRIGYDISGSGKPEEIVHLGGIDPRKCRHLVLILDGMPYDVLKEYVDQGHLRLFNAPAIVIPPYPVMTDLAVEDALGYMPCLGIEAKYVSRESGKVVGGTSDYMAGRNEPFAQIIAYRAPTLDDALAYLKPRAVFEKEIHAAKRVWDKRQGMEQVMYFVSTAAMGSRLGKPGQIETLRQCERLINQVVFESHGLVQVTLMADHGQTNIACKYVDLGGLLKQKGWKVTDQIAGDRDVALVEFGLETVAALNARQPAKLAEDLIKLAPVTLVSYPSEDMVIVLSKSGKAEIHSTDGVHFKYMPIEGDPLDLKEYAGQEVDGRAVLQSTVEKRKEYPDALYRLWRAHFGLVNNPPLVIASLDDCYYSGSTSFAGAVSMASTHGGLNWRNGATFIMSTAGPITGPLRSEDIPAAVGKLFGMPFPRRQ